MRAAMVLTLCACSGGATSTPSVSPTRPTPSKSTTKTPRTIEPVDVIATLAQPVASASWIAPGPAQLTLGGGSVQALDGVDVLEVDLLEEQGNDVRVGVRLEHVRFALWMSRTRLLALLARDQRIDGSHAVGADSIEVVLRAHARVRRLARKDGKTQVRYVGAVEVEGWISDDALTDRGPAGRTRRGRVPTGRKTLMVTPGTVVRAEPKWAGRQLAVMNQGYFVDTINTVDDAWVEVSYEDGDVKVHGFISKRDPPGRTHKKKPPEPTQPTAPTATVADQTCLHLGPEPIGFVVGDRPAIVEPASRPGWFVVTFDTPWGPIAFDAKGATETDLAKCGGPST